MSWGRFFYPHTVTIRAYAGRTGTGHSWADAVDVAAEVKDEQKLVRDAAGVEVVSSTQVSVGLDVVAPVGSKVTVWAGTPSERTSEVISVGRNDNRDSPLLDSFQLLALK